MLSPNIADMILILVGLFGGWFFLLALAFGYRVGVVRLIAPTGETSASGAAADPASAAKLEKLATIVREHSAALDRILDQLEGVETVIEPDEPEDEVPAQAAPRRRPSQPAAGQRRAASGQRPGDW